MLHHVEVHDPAALMGEHYEDEEDPKRGRWQGEGVNGDKLSLPVKVEGIALRYWNCSEPCHF